jgi:hypothetical protein
MILRSSDSQLRKGNRSNDAAMTQQPRKHTSKQASACYIQYHADTVNLPLYRRRRPTAGKQVCCCCGPPQEGEIVTVSTSRSLASIHPPSRAYCVRPSDGLRRSGICFRAVTQSNLGAAFCTLATFDAQWIWVIACDAYYITHMLLNGHYIL